MATDGAGSVHALRLRLTRLGLDGAPLVGADNQIVTDALVKVSLKTTKSTGDKLEKKNAQGIVCVSFQQKDTVSGLGLGLELCGPDDEQLHMLIGGFLYQPTTDDTAGWAMPEVGTDPTPNGVSLEFWSRAVIGGSQASVNPYIWWVCPKTQWSIDELVAENDTMGPTFSGVGYQNEGWGNGPANDWPEEMPSSRLINKVRTASLPALTSGLAAVPVDA